MMYTLNFYGLRRVWNSQVDKSLMSTRVPDLNHPSMDASMHVRLETKNR